MAKAKRTRNQRQFENLLTRHSAAVGQLERVLNSNHSNLAEGLIKRIREIGCSVEQLISARNYSQPISHKFKELLDERNKYYGTFAVASQVRDIKAVRQLAVWLVQIDEKLAKLF